MGCCNQPKAVPAPPPAFDWFTASLEDKYQHLLHTWSDMQEFLPHLRRFASECRHITEFGIRTAVSTTALLAAQPDTLISYDLGLQLNYLEALDRVKGRTNFIYRQGDSREIDIEPTEMLLVDTLHTYAQLKIELQRHKDKVRKYLAFHDTTGFRFTDEVPTQTEKKGLWPAIEEEMDSEHWELCFELNGGFGMTIFKRK
jgi:hypothetical protein